MSPWLWPSGLALLLVALLLLMVVVLVVVMVLLRGRRTSPWARLGVPHRGDHFPLGVRSARAALLVSYPAQLLREYREVRAAGGLLAHSDPSGGPAVTVTDLTLVHRVMTADFSTFSDRRPPAPRVSLLSNMMMNLPSDEWRPLRDTLAPAFSAARLRRYAPLCSTRARRLAVQVLREAADAGDQGIEVEALFQRYTLDVVSAVAFGIEARVIERPDSELAVRARGLVWRPPVLTGLLRAAVARLGLTRWLPAGASSPADEAIDYFARVTLQEVARRRTVGDTERREDALQLLLDHRCPESGASLTYHQLAAQGAMLFLGGYGNTAAALAWCARCLAHHPDVQQRLYRELQDQQRGDTEDSDPLELVSRLPYLDQVVREVLRLYPAATPQLARCSTAPYSLPGGDAPPLPARATVYIPVLGIHHDPALYGAHTERFDPERFAEPARWQRPAAAWLPFGLGPRGCPAARLALLELKLAVLELVTSCQLHPATRSAAVQPRYVPGAGVMRELSGTWLHVTPRSRH